MKKYVLDPVATGKRIRELRIAHHITVEELADMLGLESVQAVYKWQKSASMPTLDNLVILSSILNVTLDELVCTREIEESESSFFLSIYLKIAIGILVCIFLVQYNQQFIFFRIKPAIIRIS